MRQSAFPGTWTCTGEGAALVPYNPCGRVVDLIRRSYQTDCLFFADGTPAATVFWFPADPKAPVLGRSSVINSLDWETNPWDLEGVGEVYGADRPFVMKRSIDGLKYDHYCGTDDDWEGKAKPLKPPATMNYREDGLPVCCPFEPAEDGGASLGEAFEPSGEGPCYSPCQSQIDALLAAGSPLFSVVPQIGGLPSWVAGQIVQLNPQSTPGLLWSGEGLYAHDGQIVTVSIQVNSATVGSNYCLSVNWGLTVFDPTLPPFRSTQFIASQQYDLALNITCSPLCIVANSALAYDNQLPADGYTNSFVCITQNPSGTCAPTCPPPGSSGGGPGAQCDGSTSATCSIEGPCGTGTYPLTWNAGPNAFEYIQSVVAVGVSKILFACTSATSASITAWYRWNVHALPIIIATGSLTGTFSPIDFTGTLTGHTLQCGGNYLIDVT